MPYILDLKSERCPHVMSVVRTALLRAIDGGFNGQVQIRTLEHSVPNKLRIFIASMGFNVKIEDVVENVIDDHRKKQLLECGDISECQLDSILHEQIITLRVERGN